MSEKRWSDAAMFSLTPGEQTRLIPSVEGRLQKERPVKTEGAFDKMGAVRTLSELSLDDPTENTGETLLSLSKKARNGFYTVSRTVGGTKE